MSKTGGKRFAAFILAITCLALTAVFLRPALAEDSSWKLKRHKEGIQVFARKMDGHLVREYRGITIVRAPLAKVIALYENTARTPEWMYMCREFKELKENGPNSKVFYFRQGLTRPANDRDAVLSRVRAEDPLTQTVTYVLSQAPDPYPIKDKVVRMLYVECLWRFTPRKDGTVEVFYQLQIDPGGSIPKWLLNNIFYVDLSFYSLKNFRQLLQGPGIR